MSTAEKLTRTRPGYSLARIVRGEADFEREVSQELLRSTQQNVAGFQSHGGILIPPSMFSALRTDAVTAGQELTYRSFAGFAPTRGPTPILKRAGARFITPPDMIGVSWLKDPEFLINWQTSEAPAVPVTEMDLTFGIEEPTPATGIAALSWSRRLAVQSVPDVEDIVRTDVERAVASAVDVGAINDTGLTGQPKGVLAASRAITVLAGITYANLVIAEQQVGNADANIETTWIGSPDARAVIRNISPSGGNVPLWADAVEPNMMLGHPTFCSRVVTTNKVIYGPWENLTVAVHAVELLIDPITRADQGLIRGTVFVLMSVALQHDNAFRIIA